MVQYIFNIYFVGGRKKAKKIVICCVGVLSWWLVWFGENENLNNQIKTFETYMNNWRCAVRCIWYCPWKIRKSVIINNNSSMYGTACPFDFLFCLFFYLIIIMIVICTEKILVSFSFRQTKQLREKFFPNTKIYHRWNSVEAPNSFF